MANSCLFSSCSKHIYSRCIRNRNVLYAKEYEQQHSKRGSCKYNNTIGWFIIFGFSSTCSIQKRSYNSRNCRTSRTKRCRCYKQDYSSTAKILRSVQRKILLFKRRRKHRWSNRWTRQRFGNYFPRRRLHRNKSARYWRCFGNIGNT